jgi:Fe-S-cluster containining protein
MAALCLSCKLCCTNGLFGSVPVEADEVDRMKAHRLPLVQRDDEWTMPFPCAAHDGRCSIYPDRPSACREYACSVLIAVSAGQMPELEGRSLLDRANALVANLRGRIPGKRNLWADVDEYCDDSPQWRLAHADLLFDLFELRTLLRRIDPNRG